MGAGNEGSHLMAFAPPSEHRTGGKGKERRDPDKPNRGVETD
jgi:hypothetical protein